MPLNPATLTEAILEITDPSRDGHVFPRNQTEVGIRWAAAARAYFSQAIVPPLLPLQLDAGEAAMRDVLSVPGAGLPQFPGAWVAFVAAIALTTISPMIALAPIGPPPIPPLPPILDPTIPAAAIAGAIHGWALSGTFTPGPPAPPTPWS